MNSPDQHVSVGSYNQPSIANTAVNAEKVANTLASKNQVPPEALITLWEYQIISQEWLSKQKPLDGFFEEGQSINPTPEQTNNNKRQCWLNNGIYRYNQLGSDWTLRQLGANIPEYHTLIELYVAAPGENNAEKMKNMWVVATGWCDVVADGYNLTEEFAYLRSRSENRYGILLTAELRPDSSVVEEYSFSPKTGIVPFGVMDKKLSNVIQLDSENYGLPPENSGISQLQRWTPFSREIPQFVVGESGNVLYNFAGAQQLAEVLWKKLPTHQEIEAVMNMNPEKYDTFSGCYGVDGTFHFQDEITYLWSSEVIGHHAGWYTHLKREGSYMASDIGSRQVGMSVRFVSGV